MVSDVNVTIQTNCETVFLFSHLKKEHTSYNSPDATIHFQNLWMAFTENRNVHSYLLLVCSRIVIFILNTIEHSMLIYNLKLSSHSNSTICQLHSQASAKHEHHIQTMTEWIINHFCLYDFRGKIFLLCKPVLSQIQSW